MRQIHIHPDAVAYRTIRVDSNGAISFSAPLTFDDAYTNCMPESLASWHIRVRQVVRLELTDIARRDDLTSPAVLVGYDEAPPNTSPLQHLYTIHYIQYIPHGPLQTPFPANLRIPGPLPLS